MTAWKPPTGGRRSRGHAARSLAPPAPPRRPRALQAALCAALAALTALAGCGIRSTSVPVDDGPAPSRAACAPPKTLHDGLDVVVHQVYLICNTQVAPVDRAVQLDNGRIDRIEEVRTLLSQLQISPRAAEAKAGFTTAVPGTLQISGVSTGGNSGALLLNVPPQELPSFAFAQLVCTLAADAAVAPTHKVVLGGPGSDSGLRSYTCTADLRSRAQAADDAGTPVR